MSIRKSTCLTPQRLDAARHNSQRSTGPRSEAGKERVKMNALKHGCDAAPENEAAVMRALSEDPERYAALQRELATTYGPGDALLEPASRRPGQALLAAQPHRAHGDGPDAPRPTYSRGAARAPETRTLSRPTLHRLPGHRPQTGRARRALRAPAPAALAPDGDPRAAPAGGGHVDAEVRDPKVSGASPGLAAGADWRTDDDVRQSGLPRGEQGPARFKGPP